MTIKMADQIRTTRASHRVLRAQVLPRGPVHQERAVVQGRADDLGDDHDAAGEQRGGEDEAQRPVQHAQSIPPLPDPGRWGDVGGQVGHDDVHFVDLQPGQVPDPVGDLAADLPGDVGH